MDMIRVFNPAKPANLVWEGGSTPIDEVNTQAQAARAAQRRWARLPARERHDAIAAFLDGVERAREQLAERMVLEQGKLKVEAAGEVNKSLVEARWMLGRTLEEVGQLMASPRPDIRAITLRRPRGVVLDRKSVV